VGFTPGSPQADGSMSVGLRDAHAWPELYFEGVGWTRFEPTPNRGSVPEYTQTQTPGSDSPTVPKPSTSTSAAPSTAPSASGNCLAEQKKLEACTSQSALATVGSKDDGTPWLPILGYTLAGLLLLVVPLLPMLWRIRQRSVRLGAHGRSEADAPAYTLATWLEVTDTAWDYGIVPDESQTPRKAAARIVRLGHLDAEASEAAEAAEAVHRMAAAVEQVLYAPHPRLTTGLAEDARRVADALHAGASRTARLRALLAPRSAVRVVWATSAYWAALSARLAARRETLLRRPSGQNS
jgi:hypothetical protein